MASAYQEYARATKADGEVPLPYADYKNSIFADLAEVRKARNINAAAARDARLAEAEARRVAYEAYLAGDADVVVNGKNVGISRRDIYDLRLVLGEHEAGDIDAEGAAAKILETCLAWGLIEMRGRKNG